jgi:hypothetical protein
MCRNLITISIVGITVGFIGWLISKIIINRFLISKYPPKKEKKENKK